MDRQKLIQKLKGLTGNKKKLFLVLGVVFAGIGSFAGYRAMSGKGHAKVAEAKAEKGVKAEKPEKNDEAAKTETAKADSAKPEAKPEAPVPEKKNAAVALLETYEQAFVNVQDKVHEIQTAEEDNKRLRLENAQLRLKMESLQFDCHAKDAGSATQQYGFKLDQETGSRVGRAMATIGYRPPGQLLPPQLYTLGVTYFKAREDEKAAVIFTFLTGLEENDAYKTAKNYLMTAVSWYRLDNFEVADQYLDKVLAVQESSEVLPFQAHARLWKGLVAERLGKHSKAQHWLAELVDHHPHSTEAGWVNSMEVERAPAGEEE